MGKRKQASGGAPAWMVTFSDLVTLLLCFFILLFAFSTIDVVKFKAISDSFRKKSIVEGGVNIISPDPPLHANTNVPLDEDKHSKDEEQKQDEVAALQEQQLDTLYEAIKQYLEENKLETVISASRDDKGVTLEIRDRVLFDSGRADIKPEGIPFLARVGQLIQNMPNPIEIEGHTDNRPISTAQFPSNWELSAARSTKVVRYFITQHQMAPDRFTALGFAEFKPIASNVTADDRALNRRVVIIVGKLTDEELLSQSRN
ncbi:flagellar motor protein MotB [Desulfuribacillus stibiiarsenatis]|uniref:flagellar motor protein MotB n=1 Tax=Desulfuribacillus stibiiarsenatis TaxID=1390249 RepID=UPI0015B3B819|nr:flagellar motor protein MotB [Desulfuribacillus stibiiarsenatis]